MMSSEYLHPTACSLAEEGHEIADRFVEVMERAAEELVVECCVAAVGCGSCFMPEEPAAIYWVAQNDGRERVPVKFMSEDDLVRDADVAREIVDAAEDLNVEVSWNGDVMKCVILGDEWEFRGVP